MTDNRTQDPNNNTDISEDVMEDVENETEQPEEEIADELETEQEELTPQEMTVEERLQQCEQEKEDFHAKFLRALADYRNLEERVIKEKAEVGEAAQAQIVRQIIPFLDNLKRAEVFIQDQGLKMIKDDFMRIITEIGVEEVELVGQPFDPAVAEVIEVVESEEDNVVVEVVLSAYRYRGKIMRHGQVKVGKKS